MSANTRPLLLALFDKFLVPYWVFFSFLCICDVAHLNCHLFLPIFNHFYPFFIPHIELSPLWGPQEGGGDVAILNSPHYGDPEKAGVISPFRPQVGPRDGKGDVAMLSDKGSRSIYVDRFWGQVLTKYLRGTQGRSELCFGGFSTLYWSENFE